MPGQRYDTIGIAPLINGVEFGGLIADKAFDANWIIAELNERGAKVVISQRPKRKAPLTIDLDIYKWRHLIEAVGKRDCGWKLADLHRTGCDERSD